MTNTVATPGPYDALAYGLPAPGLITFAEAETIGGEMHDRWELMANASPPIERTDFAWADLVQFVIRRADEVARRRSE